MIAGFAGIGASPVLTERFAGCVGAVSGADVLGFVPMKYFLRYARLSHIFESWIHRIRRASGLRGRKIKMSKTITYVDMRGATQTVTEEKAQQLLTYISKQISICHDTVAAAKQLRDAAGVKQYEDQIAAMIKVSDQLTIAILG